jgi:GT2 family glycosyltransferase
MKVPSLSPAVTICVLTYGDYPQLVQGCLESIRRNCDRNLYRLVVGANAVGVGTATYLKSLHRDGHIDDIHSSGRNLNKCPMMRRMFADVDTEFIWWFDDDSYITGPGTFERHLRIARSSPASTVMWGQEAECNHPSTFINIEDGNVVKFVRKAPWYGGLTPPSWAPGGKGEFNYLGKGQGDPRWQFILGSCWLIRTSAVRALDWPDRRLIKLGDDVLLGEAIRQQGWRLCNTRMEGVVLNGARRRGDLGACRSKSRDSRSWI